MKKLVLALTVLVLCSASFAGSQSPEKPDPQQQAAAAQGVLPSPSATTTCAFTFVSGSNNTYLKYCVTGNGNITQLQTPTKGTEMIAWGIIGEGYGVCNESPATEYHDYAGYGDSGNWGPAKVLSRTPTSVTIARTTSDGNWTLTQIIVQVASSSSVRITMSLRNNTNIDRVAYLVRYAYVIIDSVPFSDAADSTKNTAAAWRSVWDSVDTAYGLQLQNVGTPQFGFWSGYVQPIANGPNACAFSFNFIGPLSFADSSVIMAYVGSVPAHATRTATVSYKGM